MFIPNPIKNGGFGRNKHQIPFDLKIIDFKQFKVTQKNPKSYMKNQKTP